MNKVEQQTQVDGLSDWFKFITSDAALDSQKMFSSESYYKTFWEHSLHAIAVVSEDGLIVEANPAFCHLIGIQTNEAVGINIRNLVADGEFREDMRMIDTMVLGQMVEGVTDERWNFRLDAHGPFIPVRLNAMRIPANRNRPFKHIIIQVYDLRSTQYNMQGTNWGEKKWGDIIKQLLVENFGKIATLALILLLLLGLNGNLGHTVDHMIDAIDNNKRPVYIKDTSQIIRDTNHVENYQGSHTNENEKTSQK